MTLFESSHFRQQFPLLAHFAKNNNLKFKHVYVDNAATTQKPQCVIDIQQKYYQEYNANVHRASHTLSAQATCAFEEARNTLKGFINAKSIKEIIWTKGATESINLVAQSLARGLLKPNDEIVVSVGEHHANIVPWQLVAELTGAVIKVLPLSKQGIINVNALDSIISSKTKLVVCAHISNVLGRINPIKKIVAKAKSVGAFSLIDGAQAVAHLKVDVQDIGCDFYVFSAHKMYGPTGVGVLYGREEVLDIMQPYQGGGEMIKHVSLLKPTTFNELPFKFEAGTPNIAGVIGFGKAADFLRSYLNDSMNKYATYEKELTRYCYQALNDIQEIQFIAEGLPDIGVLSFTVLGHHNHDIATTLDSLGVAIRAGHHCAMPLMESLKIDGCLRVSLSAYNTLDEVDYLVQCLRQILVEEIVNSEEKSDYLLPLITESDHAINKIKHKFSLVKGWDGKHREIMLMGKQLDRLGKEFRNEQSLISGCESQAWLIINKGEQGKYSFRADSDAKIIRGLLVIVLAAFNNKSTQEINEFAIEDYFSELGLMQHLSPSRGNGLRAIVDKIIKLSKEI